ncbi:hypothetical protein GCM10007094_38760 [Pseudovibrio japonicus]|uniref:TonB C-terminal domain-containing protein n=1 Tax=Pseudovibrio japonicus TaxID=366534 RepID=A0ABQ3ELD6_9HYPH|nr:TonB family protein [Pseudovibrio japonicus]GHB45578.1 hypothetical protein GCM10007094_38760 [Pseudovibrio japonicus]
MRRGPFQKVGGPALTAALLVSVSVHAAGFAWFYAQGSDVQIASTHSTSISVVGSIEDLIAGSKEVVEPVEPDLPTELYPREIEAEQPVEPLKEIVPTELAVAEITPVQSADPIVPAVVPVAEGVTIKSENEPVQPKEEIESVKPQLQPEQINSAEVQELKPAETAKPQSVQQPKPAEQVRESEPAQPPEPMEAVQPEEAKPIEPEKPEELNPVEKRQAEPVEDTKDLEAKPLETEVAAQSVPIPRAAPPRPKLLQKTKPKRTANKEPARRTGNSDVNSARGSQSARKGSSSAKNGSDIAGSGNTAGNAATSNYWGKVQTKIQRAAQKRYPRREKKRKKSGVVHVSFAVHKDGSVTGIKLSRSSGNERFDQAALKAVEAAAPFPPFPPSIRSGTVRKTAPITFKPY